VFYVLGTAIFAVLAVVVVIAFFQARKRRQDYERHG
jgi:hypothetical protein